MELRMKREFKSFGGRCVQQGKDVMRSCREKMRKAKTQLEPNLALLLQKTIKMFL